MSSDAGSSEPEMVASEGMSSASSRPAATEASAGRNGFDNRGWILALGNAEAMHAVADVKHTFDVDKYLSLLQEESLSNAALLSPMRLFELHSKQEISQLLEKCEIHPVGHRVAVYCALLSLSESQQDLDGGGASDDDVSVSEDSSAAMDEHHCHHHEVHSEGSSYTTASHGPPLRHATSPNVPSIPRDAPSKTLNGSDESLADTATAQNRTYLRAQCKALLRSTINDVHVQLLRPGAVGKRVKVGGKEREAPFYSGTFDIDSPMVAPECDANDSSEEGYTWVDIVGRMNPGEDQQPDDDRLFMAKYQHLKEQYESATADGMSSNDDHMERVRLVSSQRLHHHYGNLATTAGPMSLKHAVIQTDGLDKVLCALELEYGIELPLCAITRRVQCPSTYGAYGMQSEREQRDQRSSRYSCRSRASERIRKRIEEGMSMNYLNASMFAQDELQELRINARKEGRLRSYSHSGSMGERYQKMLQEEERMLAELSHQHVIVLNTASSPVGEEQHSKLLPPSGSEQLSDIMKTNQHQLGLILGAFLEEVDVGWSGGANARFSEQWILYVDTKARVVVTIRPKDVVAVGRIHHSFANSFGKLSFHEFVSILTEGSVVHYRAHVDYMYKILDEVQRFLAPTSVYNVVSGSADKEYNTVEARRQRSLRRKYNVQQHDPTDKSFFNSLKKLKALIIRSGRSLWRKIKRKRQRPRDITVAALRLLNLVNRQASVFFRNLSTTAHSSETTRTALLISPKEQYNIEDPIRFEMEEQSAVLRRRSYRASPAALRFSSMAHLHKPHAAHTSAFHLSSSHDAHHHMSDDVAAAHNKAPTAATSPSSMEDILQDAERLAEETSERCAQLRHLSTELMSLAMALDSDTYDENLNIIGFLTALFAPLSYWCTNMGTNFRNPLFHAFLGYWETLFSFAVFAAVLCIWYFDRYHDKHMVDRGMEYLSRFFSSSRRRSSSVTD